MPPGALKKQLVRIGRIMRRYQALAWFKFGASATLLWLWTAAVADLLLKMDRPVRLLLWGILLLIGSFVLWRTVCIQRRRFSIQGVAARIEHVFPALNNRLINFIQFSENPGRDVFKLAYIRSGVPGWSAIDAKKLRDRRADRHGRIALALAVAFLLVPWITAGRAWQTALWRTVNPFTALAPASRTRLIEVQPGNQTVPSGDPLVLLCRVNGHKGHRVRLDVRHADGAEITYNLGELERENTDQVFSHRIARVKTQFDYRFRAGDAPSPPWFRITPRPPLALTSVLIEETPPGYLGVPKRTWNVLEETPTLHENAELHLKIRANNPLKSAVVQFSTSATNALRAEDELGLAWAAPVPSEPSPMILRARSDREQIEFEIAYERIRDDPPSITIREPNGPVRLGPKGQPALAFTVEDDHGLAWVAIERIVPGGDLNKPGEILAEWRPEDRRAFEQFWTPTNPAIARPAGILALRVAARDTRGPGEGVLARSDPVHFTPFGYDRPDEDETDQDEKNALMANLARVIELQTLNIEHTRRASADPDSEKETTWNDLAERQRAIRELGRALLAMPGKTLGPIAPRLRNLYLNEMREAVALLHRLSREPAETRPALLARALSIQERILRQLRTSGSTAGRNQVETAMNDVAALLHDLIQQQEDVIEGTKTLAAANTPVSGSVLVDRQDGLASDMAAFIRTLEQESGAIAAQDAEFADLLRQLAEQAKSRRIRESMLQAADFLDRDKPPDALRHASRALEDLRALKHRLESVRAGRKEERIDEIRETLAMTAEKMGKIRELHEKAIESMDALREQGDLSKAETDLMEEEYSELLETTRDALLDIPVDLHIFSELNAANDMVEDVFSVFEEVEQQAGSEKLQSEDVNFQPFSKENLEVFLESMKEAEGFMADMEFWLPDKPDDQQITFEAFDAEEMPESGMAVGDLAAQAQDLIGDLLEEADDLEEAAEDSATNLGLSDLPIGEKVLEGEQTSYSAGGKSGNVRPDHKEQDGRSNIGREGMASGETAAGSGTIQEGDPNIEARRTQDPTMDGQVYAEGEAQTKATGGGKLGSGKGDDYGMEGEGARRMDSTEAGSMQGMEALLARKAEKLAFQASLQNVRSASLEKATHHLRQAADAVARGRPIREVAELRQQAAASLRRAATELQSGVGAEISGSAAPDLLEGAVEGASDAVPAAYKKLLSEYYRNLNENL